MKIKHFEESIAWQRAQELAVWVYATFGLLKDHGFKSQICRAAVSISNNIAEGFDRNSDKELIQFLRIARGSASEVKSMLFLAEKIGYIPQESSAEGKNQCDEIGKIINGLINYLKNSR
jgi:four helix bundle protein